MWIGGTRSPEAGGAPKRRGVAAVLLLAAAPGVAEGQGYTLWTFNGPGYSFGSPIASAGDIDADGYSDVAVGEPFAIVGGVSAGAVRVFSGASGTPLLVLTGSTPYEQFGSAIASLGDVDGDSVPDLLVGAPQSGVPGGTGYARVFSGAGGGMVFSFLGDPFVTRFGSSVAGPGDMDGDGVPDIAVGSPFAGPPGLWNVGQVKVFSGSSGSTIQTLNGAAVGDFFGGSLAAAGDVDGDGSSDLLAGAPQVDPGAGYARVYSGASGSLLFTLTGTSPGDRFGSVAGGGDFNGDGVPDFAVGASQADPAGLVNAGQLRIFSGTDGSGLLTLNGAAAFDFFGSPVASLPDLNGDGLDDIAVGTPLADTGGTSTGRATVHSGANGATLLTVNGSSPLGYLGTGLAAAGDLDADGVPDLAVGSTPASGVGQARVISFVGVPSGSALSGSPCPGSSGVAPLIQTAGGNPSPGNAAFSVVLSRSFGGTPAILIVGATSISSNLGALGLPGCTLLVFPDSLIPATTTSSGLAFAPVPVPPIPSLVGGVARFQWYVVDPGPSPVPGAMSPRLEVLVVP